MKLRYVELEPDKIFNWLNPMNVTCWCNCHNWHDTWWEPKTVKLREEFGRIWAKEFDKITGHFSKLEESILKNGITHPISTVSGHLRGVYLEQGDVNSVAFSPSDRTNIKNIIYTHTFGGSRLTIAQKHNIKIPCAVHDFSNLFEDKEEITSGNFRKWFSTNYRFADSMPYLILLRHSHINEGKYTGMNDETRMAQRKAAEIAKKKINEQYNMS